MNFGKENPTKKFASFGAIHLNNTNLNTANVFWTQIVGMTPRGLYGKTAEFGTQKETLVVVHETATKGFEKGYSGLYHFAIHAPNIAEFARMIQRLIINNYPFSPVDHTMSKSIYLDDPDGITIEFTLETPERFKRTITDGGIRIEDVNGNVKSASDHLDLKEVMQHLEPQNDLKTISNDTYIGHLHLYAHDVGNSVTFFKNIGFLPFNNLPQYSYADMGAGGPYQHRIALNSWHGHHKPIAPKENAGMRHFHIKYHSQEKLKHALRHILNYERKDDGYWSLDPTGNRIIMTKQ